MFRSLAVLTFVASTAVAQSRPIIMIDPGHGGEVAGVEAAGVLEKEIALRAAFVLAEELVVRGFDVRLTRTGDQNVDFNYRRTMAEEAGASLLVSLHFNGDESPDAHGIEIYTNLDVPRGAEAAHAVARALEATGGPVVVEGRTWEFVSSPSVPTVMIEAGFLTHPVERRLILSRAHHRDLARLIADGAEAFLR